MHRCVSYLRIPGWHGLDVIYYFYWGGVNEGEGVMGVMRVV